MGALLVSQMLSCAMWLLSMLLYIGVMAAISCALILGKGSVTSVCHQLTKEDNQLSILCVLCVHACVHVYVCIHMCEYVSVSMYLILILGASC